MRAGWLEGTAWVVAMGALLTPPRPAPVAPPTEAEQVAAAGGLVETQVVQVRVPREAPAGWRAPEAAGHVLLFLDLFLADLPGVVPKVEGVPDNPGLALALATEAPPWTVEVTFGTIGETEVQTQARVCDGQGACTDHAVAGRRALPNAAAAEIVAAIGARMGRASSVPMEVQVAPLTRDDYAILMAGRAAATLYGLYPAVAPELQGDPRRDPVARAAFLDPRIASTWTVVARSTPVATRRLLAWKVASEAMPMSAALRAGYAALLDAGGSVEASDAAWQGVAGLALTDMRFLVPRAKSALAVGRTRQAEEILALVPERYAEHPLIAAMNVAVADAHGGADDAVLKRWQAADPTNAEPVRRRIALFVRGGQFEPALSLAPELRRRGAVEEGWRLAMALANDLGRYGEAAAAAREVGEADAARRLAAAEAAGHAPEERAVLLAGADEPGTRLLHAESLLSAGKVLEARGEVDRLLKADPWWPEALDLQVRVLGALGQQKGAAEARSRLLFADPLYHEGRVR